MNPQDLAQLICRSLETSPSVEIDGLGVFYRDEAGKIAYSDTHLPRVFIAYALEDSHHADRLYDALEANGFAPWMDRRKLMPGQNWPQRIREAIESADFFIACFSRNSVNKRGGFQVELRHALDCASRFALDDIFLMPVRLDACRVPARITRETQYIDLFPDWDAGLRRLVRTMRRQGNLRDERGP